MAERTTRTTASVGWRTVASGLCSTRTSPAPYITVARTRLLLSLMCSWAARVDSVGGFGLDLLDRRVEPVGSTAGTGHLGLVHLVDIPADDKCRDRSGEAGLIVKRGRVRRMGSDRDGGDHIIDEG